MKVLLIKTENAKPLLIKEKLGIPLKEFVKINLKAMQSISNELGL